MIIKRSQLLPVLALALLVLQPGPAKAQTSTSAHPLFHVQGTPQQNAVVGLTPAQIKHAYGFDQIANQGDGQTIAIVDAFDYPSIQQTLSVFDQKFNLPDLAACPSPNPCFQTIFATGSNPGTNDPNYQTWALEIALDVEWAHAIAPRANIILVEAAMGTLDSLLQGVDVALQNGATVVSMSWGGAEFATEFPAEDWHFLANNVTFFAAAGDAGHGAIYPAASPYVMSVGATTLKLDNNGNYKSEKAWSGSGGGLSLYEAEPIYQSAYPIHNDPLFLRGTPDVAFDGDPATGVVVYDSVPYAGSTGWSQIGGTSIGPPQWSALVAIANSLRALRNAPALTGSQGFLYTAVQNAGGLTTYHDITNGSDGNCGNSCHGTPGYDYVTGLGTPRADLLIPGLQP